MSNTIFSVLIGLVVIACGANALAVENSRKGDTNNCSDEKADQIKSLQTTLALRVRELQIAVQRLANLQQERSLGNEVNRLVTNSRNRLRSVSEKILHFHEAHISTSVKRQTTNCSGEDRIRLVNGSNAAEGRIEFLVDGVWNNLCEDGWNVQDAKLLCSVLGHPGTAVSAVGANVFGSGREPVIPPGSCQAAAGVICDGLQRYPVRLVNGSHSREGRVEVFVGGEWGSVCHSGWGVEEARVVCHSLGFTGDVVAVGGSVFGRGTGRSWLRDLACVGTEQHLLSCPAAYPAGYRSPCTHLTDAGVLCGLWRAYPLRLVGGTSSREGRVEIHLFNEWGTINSNGWDDADAAVICRTLGHNGAGAKAVTDGSFGPGSNHVLLGQVNCIGNEEHVLECQTSQLIGTQAWPHLEDAGVRCQP